MINGVESERILSKKKEQETGEGLDTLFRRTPQERDSQVIGEKQQMVREGAEKKKI